MHSKRKKATPLKAHLMENMTLSPVSGCWEWNRSRIKDGYGQIGFKKGKNKLVHRVAYALWVGPIPDGQKVCHKCDNPPCFNPEHLFLGTQKDNMADCGVKGRLVTKLTARDVIEIRSIHQRKEATMTSLARRFKVTVGCVSTICSRKKWAFV